jgi:hypothetical protein
MGGVADNFIAAAVRLNIEIAAFVRRMFASVMRANARLAPREKGLKAIVSLILLFAIGACSGYSITGGPGRTVAPSLQSTTLSQDEISTVKQVYLMPSQLQSGVGQAAGLQLRFDAHIRSAWEGECGFTAVVAPENKAQPALAASADLQAALAEARRRNADAVLETTVQEYTERICSAVGGEQPAAVAFRMRVYRALSGREIWNASYVFRDQAWSENVFRMLRPFEGGRKLGWLSAQDILQEGARRACLDFEARGRGEGREPR